MGNDEPRCCSRARLLGDAQRIYMHMCMYMYTNHKGTFIFSDACAHTGYCLPSQLRCAYFTCINSTLACNGVSDCDNRYDELHCRKLCNIVNWAYTIDGQLPHYITSKIFFFIQLHARRTRALLFAELLNLIRSSKRFSSVNLVVDKYALSHNIHLAP